VAVDTLRQADAISDAIVWLMGAVRGLFGRKSGRLLHNS
jgi:hypothetical protein